MGWIIVTIVGFITAVLAFLIVRSEQLLFDFKEGYCSAAWWKAKRFCCQSGDDLLRTTVPFRTFVTLRRDEGDACSNWTTWSDVLGPRVGSGEHQIGDESWVIEYASYTVIAVRPCISCW